MGGRVDYLLDSWVTETGPSVANSSAFLVSEICVRFLAAIWPFPTTDSMGPFPTPKRLFPYGPPAKSEGAMSHCSPRSADPMTSRLMVRHDPSGSPFKGNRLALVREGGHNLKRALRTACSRDMLFLEGAA